MTSQVNKNAPIAGTAGFAFIMEDDGSGNLIPLGIPAPSGVARAAIAPTNSTAMADSLVIKASAGNLYSVSMYASSDSWLMIFDAVSKPSNGTVSPAFQRFIPAGTYYEHTFVVPLKLVTGITAVCSSTGPYNLTAAATGAFEAQAL